MPLPCTMNDRESNGLQVSLLALPGPDRSIVVTASQALLADTSRILYGIAEVPSILVKRTERTAVPPATRGLLKRWAAGASLENKVSRGLGKQDCGPLAMRQSLAIRPAPQWPRSGPRAPSRAPSRSCFISITSFSTSSKQHVTRPSPGNCWACSSFLRSAMGRTPPCTSVRPEASTRPFMRP